LKRLQESVTGKFLAVLLLASMTFCAAYTGVAVLGAVPYLECGSVQETQGFYTLLRQRQNSIADGCARLMALEKSEDLLYTERQILVDELEARVEALSAENTWFRFQVKTADGQQTIYSNLEDDEVLESVVEKVWYATFVPGEHLSRSGSDAEQGWSDSLSLMPAPSYEEASSADVVVSREDISVVLDADLLVIECGVPDIDAVLGNGTIGDEFSELAQEYDRAHQNASALSLTWTATCLLACCALLWLLWTAGHRSGVEGIAVTWQEKIFLEIYLSAGVAAGMFCGVLLVNILEEVFYYNYYGQRGIVLEDLVVPGSALLITVLMGIITLLLRTCIVRMKAGILARTSLICRLLGLMRRMIVEIIRAMPFLWKVIMGFLLYFFGNLLLGKAAYHDGTAGFFWFVLHGAALLFLCWWAVGFRRLQRGSRAMAEGNVEHQIDTRLLFWDLRRHAEDLNNLSRGLAAAVDERIKSERFKAELITNVSHDLKTPLTSIINYVDLLKTTRQDDPKAVEYIEVLDRKSQRLKKLTEDLVEASKASTGVLAVSREKIGVEQLLDQALGEWTEKLEGRRLSVVTNLPEGETWVYADGRHLWRVLDNLLSNCCKYAMEGTRIYIDLVRGKGQVTLCVKNISREALNVPAERLMERFVRGEESRSGEGSGLGLSIARSLTELQGGTFQVAVGGDLFKAVITLPQAV